MASFFPPEFTKALAAQVLSGTCTVEPTDVGRGCIVDTCALLDACPAETFALFQNFASGSNELSRAVASQASGGLPSRPASIRFAHLPPCLGLSVSSVKDIRYQIVNRFVVVTGRVARLGAIKAAECSKIFQCRACGVLHQVQVAVGCRADAPAVCGLAAVSKGKAFCSSTDFALSSTPAQMVDYQEFRLQDLSIPEAGESPGSITVVLMDELVGTCSLGDRVVVGGLAKARWLSPVLGARVQVELFVEANHVRPLGQEGPAPALKQQDQHVAISFQGFWDQHWDSFRGRRELVEATANSLHGMQVAKLALLLTLIGGARMPAATIDRPDDHDRPGKWSRFLDDVGVPDMELSDTNKVSLSCSERMTPHLLIVGDPGTGKSQLLHAAAELSSCGICTNSVGATKSGLTCICTRDGAGWALEAGALVLADGGVCCIDEFSHTIAEERAALHEAMEQQTLSIAKRGFVCQLRCRCSVVAAQNWARSRAVSDPGLPSLGCADGSSLAAITGLAPPLLSRFDVILALRKDAVGGDRKQEEDMVDAILDASAAPFQNLTIDLLTEYIKHLRNLPLQSPMDPTADDVLQRYYCRLRSAARRRGSTPGDEPVTVRTFQSLLRLSQAHARLMLHDPIQLTDVVAVVFLHQVTLRSHSPDTNQLLGPDDLGPGAPRHLKAMDVHSDIRSSEDYDVVESAVLRMLGFKRRSSGGLDVARRHHNELPPSRVWQRYSSYKREECDSAMACSPNVQRAKRWT